MFPLHRSSTPSNPLQVQIVGDYGPWAGEVKKLLIFCSRMTKKEITVHVSLSGRHTRSITTKIRIS